MKITLFSYRSYDEESFEQANKDYGFELVGIRLPLCQNTVMAAAGSDVICVFVNDEVDRSVIIELHKMGVQMIALRCSGFNNIDLEAAHEVGIPVCRVPSYTPHSVAEHVLALTLTLNRKIHKAYARVRDGNFTLDHLVGFDLYGKTVGVIGTGRIGATVARLFKGIGCKVLLYDPFPNNELAAEIDAAYVPLDDIYTQSRVISLHVPLTEESHYMVCEHAFHKMRTDAILINTSRGGLICTDSLIAALKRGQIGGAGLDVYEEEDKLFFKDLSQEGINDDKLARLLTFPNVIVTAHQAFLTIEALLDVANTTLQNIASYQSNKTVLNEVLPSNK